MQETLDSLYDVWNSLNTKPGKTTKERGMMDNLYALILKHGGNPYRVKMLKAKAETKNSGEKKSLLKQGPQIEVQSSRPPSPKSEQPEPLFQAEKADAGVVVDSVPEKKKPGRKPKE